MEQRKRVTASMTTFNGSVPALCQRMKPAMPSSRHAATNGLNVEDDMKIQEFMRWHNNRVKKGRRDIPVKNLRHIIPTFILRCFAMKEDQPSQKKVKGLWDRPPNGWDHTVPFLDPNNKGDQGKPKKEVLMMMFEYLITEYQKTGNTAMDLTKGPIQESEILMEPEDTDEGKPVEVADDIDSYDWNPLEDCKQRIMLKLPYTQSERRLSNGEIGVLNVAKDVLFRLFDLLGKKESLLHAHDFECTLDTVRVTGVLPPDHNQKWREFEVEGKNLDFASCPQTLEKQQLLSDENIRELGISTQHNPLVSGRTDDFSSIVSFRENLCSESDIISMCKKGTENENKFAIADAIITEDKKPLNPDETAKFTGSQLQLLEDAGFDGFFGMFDEDNSGDLLDANPGPDLTDYFTKDVDWMEDIGPLEMAGNDSLMKEGKLCEDVHTPSLDHCVPLADDTNAGFVNNDDISVYQRERHNSVESIDSDHSYVQKSEIASEYRSGMSTLLSPTSNVCSQVAMLRISSPSLDTAEYMERGTKRGYSDAGNHLEPKHSRTEDMDIDRDGGEQPTYEGELSTLVEFM